MSGAGRLTGFCLAAALVFLLSACAQKPPKPGLLESQFERIAFSSEMRSDRRKGILVKWQVPVRVWVPRDGVGDRYLLPVHRRLQELMRITGHDIALAGPHTGTGNLHLRFVSRSQVEAKAQADAACYTQVIERGGVIVWGDIYIARDSEEQIAHCLTEELVQSLGLLDDSPLIAGSIFSETTDHEHLIFADSVLLEVLYNRRLTPGMSKQQAMPIVRTLIGDILRR